MWCRKCWTETPTSNAVKHGDRIYGTCSKCGMAKNGVGSMEGEGIVDDIKQKGRELVDKGKEVVRKGAEKVKKAGRGASCEAYVWSTLTPDKTIELGLKSAFTGRSKTDVLKEHRRYHKDRCMKGVEGPFS